MSNPNLCVGDLVLLDSDTIPRKVTESYPGGVGSCSEPMVRLEGSDAGIFLASRCKPITPPDPMVRWQECGPRPGTPPDPKDARIDYYERVADEAKIRANELQMERDQLRQQVAELENSYVPPDIAMECLRLLEPLDVVGEPNTLLALVAKAMKVRDRLTADLVAQGERNDMTRREVLRVVSERDAARAECERQREYHEAAFRIVERDTATIRRLEAAAGRHRAAMLLAVKHLEQDAPNYPLATYLRSALAETDAGTRTLAVIEAARKLLPLDCTPDIVFRPAWDALAEALAQWDACAKHSTGHGSDMSGAGGKGEAE